MNAAQKRRVTRWIKNLRSGKFKQGLGALAIAHTTDKTLEVRNCCLGVLAQQCRVPREKAVPVERWDNWDLNFTFPEGDESGYPPADWFEEKTGLDGAVMTELATMNDNRKSFKQIARHIEKLVGFKVK